VVAALVVLVGTAGAAVIALGAMYFNQITSKPPEPSPIPTLPPCNPSTLGFVTCLPTPPVTAQAPPLPTVTVTAEPPSTTVAAAAPTPALELTSTDQQFLTALRNYGLTYPDPEYAINVVPTVNRRPCSEE
jgi:hypothetical protein